MTQAYDAWVTCPKPNPRARVRLFCFPYAGGGASVFRTWPDALPAEIEVCPIQLPGRENRFKEPRYTSLPSLVQALGEVMNPYLNIPFIFFGHSLGALISFELGRYLREHMGLLPLHLFACAYRAPQLRSSKPPIHHLPDALFIEALRELNGTPREVFAHAELMRVLLPLLRADFTLVGTYRYVAERRLDCPICALGGLQDDEVRQDALAAWHEQTTSAFTLHMFAGDHFFLQSNRAAVLHALTQEIAQVLTR